MFCFERLQGALACDHVLETEVRQQRRVLIEVMLRLSGKIDMQILDAGAQLALLVNINPLEIGRD
jgi:hypothetical protein